MYYCTLHFTDKRDTYDEVTSQKKLPGKSVWNIVHASPNDSGFYICVAENTIASIQTNGIIISISGKK